MNCFIAEQYIHVSVLLQNKYTSKGTIKPGVCLQAARYFGCAMHFYLRTWTQEFSQQVLKADDCEIAGRASSGCSS
jgi:hypothetical protein